MLQTFYFTNVESCVGIESEETKISPKNRKVVMELNDNQLVLSSFGIMLKVNKRM